MTYEYACACGRNFIATVHVDGRDAVRCKCGAVPQRLLSHPQIVVPLAFATADSDILPQNAEEEQRWKDWGVRRYKDRWI